MNFIIQLTDGFDGAVLKETARTTKAKSLVWLRASVPDPALVKPQLVYTRLSSGGRGPERTVINYGSHKYYGRLYCTEDANQP